MREDEPGMYCMTSFFMLLSKWLQMNWRSSGNIQRTSVQNLPDSRETKIWEDGTTELHCSTFSIDCELGLQTLLFVWTVCIPYTARSFCMNKLHSLWLICSTSTDFPSQPHAEAPTVELRGAPCQAHCLSSCIIGRLNENTHSKKHFNFDWTM